MNNKENKRKRRHARVRAKIKGTSKKPRLSVFRSNAYIYAELIDDDKGRTIASSSSFLMKEDKGTLKEKAYEVGKRIAKDAKQKKISKVVFDRGGFMYHGSVEALATGAREGGLSF